MARQSRDGPDGRSYQLEGTDRSPADQGAGSKTACSVFPSGGSSRFGAAIGPTGHLATKTELERRTRGGPTDAAPVLPRDHRARIREVRPGDPDEDHVTLCCEAGTERLPTRRPRC